MVVRTIHRYLRHSPIDVVWVRIDGQSGGGSGTEPFDRPGRHCAPTSVESDTPRLNTEGNFWSPDPRLREKLDDWSSGQFLSIPLVFEDEEDPIAFISLIRDYIFSRDLFYETTPVHGERFFGRRKFLQSLRDDVRNQGVAGVFGLRKAGKTSVLTELARSMADTDTLMILRDLESLPSPPDDPVPDLLRDLVEDLREELKTREISTRAFAALPPGYGITEFKRAVQQVLRKLAASDISVVLMLDEIEYLTPSDRLTSVKVTWHRWPSCWAHCAAWCKRTAISPSSCLG